MQPFAGERAEYLLDRFARDMFEGIVLSMGCSRSKLGVVAPSIRSATYSFSSACRASAILVALPMQTSRMPVASGSSVPAWPTLIFG